MGLLALCLALVLAVPAPEEEPAAAVPTPTTPSQIVGSLPPTSEPTTAAPTVAPTAIPTTPPTAAPQPTAVPQPTATTAPAVPFAVTFPKNGAKVQQETVLVRGRGAPGQEVTLDKPGFDEHAMPDASGNWQMQVVLQPGANELKLRQGERGTANSKVLNVSYAPPATPTPVPTATPPPSPTSTPTPKPKPTNTPEPIRTTLYVDAADQGFTGANVRAQPNRNAPRLGYLANGGSVTVVGEPLRRGGESWYRVTYRGKTGYIVGSLLDRERPRPAARPKPPTPTPTAQPKPPTPTPTPVPDEVDPPAGNCDPNYEGACIPPYSEGDVNCPEITARDFRIVGRDPHRLDGNPKNGIGCESD